MKICLNPRHCLILIGMATLPFTNALASSSFQSQAILTFTINQITNDDNPGSTAGLNISASFEQTQADSSITGDGIVNDSNPSYGPTPLVGTSFPHTYIVGGNVDNGSVDSSHIGLSGLSFSNTGADHYYIEVTLNYELSATTTGEYADSTVSLDYFNTDFSFSGFDSINASIFGTPSDSVSGASPVYSFILNPGDSQSFSGQVGITGALQASGTVVPIPAAAWLFLSALSGLATFKKKQA